MSEKANRENRVKDQGFRIENRESDVDVDGGRGRIDVPQPPDQLCMQVLCHVLVIGDYV